MWYMIRNLRCTVTIDSVLANSKTQNAFLFTVNAIFRHVYPLAVEPASTPRPLVQNKTWRDSLPIDMLLSAVSVLVVAQSSSESRRDLRITLYVSFWVPSQGGLPPGSLHRSPTKTDTPPPEPLQHGRVQPVSPLRGLSFISITDSTSCLTEYASIRKGDQSMFLEQFLF